MKGSKMKTLKRIFSYARGETALFVLVLLLSVLVSAGQLAVPFLVGSAIDCLGENVSALNRYFIAIGACVAATGVAQWFLSAAGNRVVYHILCSVRKDAFSKISRLPLSYLDSRPFGETASVIISDAEQFSEGLLLAFNQLFTGLSAIVGVLGVMLALRWEIALIVFCITPVSFFAARFIALSTYRTFRKQSEVRADQTAFLDEAVAGLKVVKAYSHEGENEEVFRAGNENYRKVSLKAVFLSSTTNPTTRFINALVYAAVALAGCIFVITTAGAAVPFTVGRLTTFLSYANQYTKPFNEISEVAAEFQNALACAERLFALIGEEEEPPDEDLPALGEAEGEVALKEVTFSYSPEKKLIEGLSLTAGAGKRIAIVGPTGCGKTTLVNLLMRFYDVQGGAVEVDGKDVRSVTRASLRENYGMVLQETWLKEGTVRENLCMGAPDCTEEEMVAAAKAAHCHSFIMRLPQGYDTVLKGEGSLSQGQKQLLCIARVMLCRPPMLILDEATSSIDTRTERLVQDAFARLMQGRTCFVVAHRLSTIETADLIVVMRAGSIVEQGTHGELLAKGGFYAELYRAQFAG